MTLTLSSPPFDVFPTRRIRIRRRSRSRTSETAPALKAAAVSPAEAASVDEKPTKLITFLGKGGSGKTTSAVFAAKHYAREGYRTCLVTQTHDPTADFLLNCRIGPAPVVCGTNLSAVRLETTKLLLDPLYRIKQADARVNMTQGFLQGIVGEELGVLPGMDSILSVFALEGLIGFQGNAAPRKVLKDEFDVMIYDGASADETLRMIGAAAATRLYLKYLRNMAEKTDLGRLIGPSLLRLVDEAMSLSGKRPPPSFNGKLSSETWESLENYLERKSSSFAEPDKFGCYVVMDPCSPVSRSAALRYWGCAIQAGAQVSGAFGVTSAGSCGELEAVESSMKTTLSPLPFALITKLSMDSHSPPDWDAIMQNSFGEKARKVLHLPGRGKASTSILPSVKYDLQNKSITLFMPGFNKSEIKLYQYRGGSELLVEAGDQRRVIELPRQVQGKVGGAKFIDRSLVITVS